MRGRIQLENGRPLARTAALLDQVRPVDLSCFNEVESHRKFIARSALYDKTSSAALQGFIQVALVPVLTNKDKRKLREVFVKVACCGKAAQDWHRDIKQNQVWSELLCRRDPFLSVCCLSDDFAALLLNDPPQERPNGR